VRFRIATANPKETSPSSGPSTFGITGRHTIRSSEQPAARFSSTQSCSFSLTTAARAIGVGTVQIACRTILLNCLCPLLVQPAFIATGAVLLKAILSFLGIGERRPTPSWGGYSPPAKIFPPVPVERLLPQTGVALMVLSFDALGDAQRVVDHGWRAA